MLGTQRSGLTTEGNKLSSTVLGEDWAECPYTRLRKVIAHLKYTQYQMTDFKLWLEFEEVDPGSWDIENDFANIHVGLPDGRHYGLNIWTYKFFETAINDDIM